MFCLGSPKALIRLRSQNPCPHREMRLEGLASPYHTSPAMVMAVMSHQWIGGVVGFVGRLDCHLSISQYGQAHIRTAGVEFESGPQNRRKIPLQNSSPL